MRITAGKIKGRKLDAPEGDKVRPTSDRARQAIFNILEHGKPAQIKGDVLRDAQALDVFCGTGALGLEALSRGASYAAFIDLDVSFARANAENAGVVGDCDFYAKDAAKPGAAPQQFDLVFLDPPYDSGLIAPVLAALSREGWIAKNAVIVAETGRKKDIELPEGFKLLDSRVYGAAKTEFFLFSPE